MIKLLGNLTKEQKEQTWKESISGSQAWMLINEPYNLIRDKLGIERIHPSKYDFLNSERMKLIGDNAKAQGTFYEPMVMEELKQHEPNYSYVDWTFEKLNEEFSPMRVTATPDFFDLTNPYQVELEFSKFGDIKCSTSAHNAEEMSKRYYWQLLHNAYVLNCLESELVAKNEITKPIERYKFTFTPEQLKEYENYLIEFCKNVREGNVEAYDSMYQPVKLTKDIEKDTLIANEEQTIKLETLLAKQEELKALEEEVKALQAEWKQNFENAMIVFNDRVFTITTTERAGSVDYAKLVKDLNIPKETLETYRKASSKVQTLKFK